MSVAVLDFPNATTDTPDGDRDAEVINLFRPLGEWARRAACIDADPSWFDYAERGADPRIVINGQRKAAQVCARCPVRTECAVEATQGRHPGVWGGYWFDERGQRKLDLVARLHNVRFWADRICKRMRRQGVPA